MFSRLLHPNQRDFASLGGGQAEEGKSWDDERS